MSRWTSNNLITGGSGTTIHAALRACQGLLANIPSSEVMLEENPTTTTPAEPSEDLHQFIFREKMTRRAQARAHRRTQVRVLLGAILGAVLLILFYLGLSSIFGSGGSDTLTQQGSVLQGASSGQLVPSALDEPVTLSVTSTPSGATVYLDDNPIGVTPLTSDTLKPGAWALSVEKPPLAPFDSILFLTGSVSLHLSLNETPSVAVARVPDEAEPKAPPSPIVVVQESKPAHSEEPAPVAAEAEPPSQAAAIQESEPAVSEEPMAVTTESEPAVSEESTPVATEPEPPPPKLPDTPTLQDSQVIIQPEQPDAERLKEAIKASEDSLAAQVQRDEQQYQFLAEQGDALFSQGNYDAALAKYGAMLVLKPSDAYAQEKIAESKRALEPVRVQQEMPEVIAKDDVSPPSEEPPKLTSESKARPPKPTYRTRGSGPGRRVRIVKIHGRRTLEVGEVENFRVDIPPETTPPTKFYWESEEGVFAVGRSVNLQFSKAGAYTITINAKNSYGTDTDTVMVTIKEPKAKQQDSKR